MSQTGFKQSAAVGLALLLVGAAGGCRFGSGTPPAPPPAGTNPNRTSAAAGASSSSDTTSQPPNWAKIVTAWWDAATGTTKTGAGGAAMAGNGTQAASATPAIQHVTIDVAAIAARHPAWELARRLERDRNSPIVLTPVAIRAIEQATLPDAFAVPGIDASLTAANAPSIVDVVAAPPRTPGGRGRTPGEVAGLDLPERRLIADELPPMQADVRTQQLNALDEFLKEVQVRQDAARNEQAAQLQLGLQYDIEAAQRSSLSRVVPILPPDAVQLELTNLRLQLLKNLYTTEAERDEARRRLEELEAQWRAQLQRQETERLAELRRLLVEIPARVRREGEAQINAYKEAARKRDAAFRQSVEEAQEGRVAQDFAPSNARLGIVLPASSLPSQSITEISNDVRPASAGAGSGAIAGNVGRSSLPQLTLPDISRTFAPGITSIRGSAAGTTVAGIVPDIPRSSGAGSAAAQVQARRLQLIRSLRTLALRDARRWSRMVAQRSGWSWPEGGIGPATGTQKGQPAAVREVTNEVLRELKLT